MSRKVTIQEKRLKAALKSLNVKENVHLDKFRRTYKNPETGRTDRFTEFGNAYSVILMGKYTAEQLTAIIAHEDIKVRARAGGVLVIES